jgi:hypothetical protein
MNEQRIKSFADHADRYAYSISDSDPSVNWYKIRDQKFAELIVRECARKSDQIENYVKTDNSCGDYLKKHFGIEE